jgi:hypothetical protein
MISLVRGAADDLLRYSIAQPEEVDAAANELRTFVNLPDATALFYWNRAEAVK